MPTNMHLKIDSIPGESRKKNHTDQIEILSWSFGMDQSAASGMGHGSGAGRVNVHDAVFTKYLCKADSALMKHCCNGKHIPEVTLYAEKAGGEDPVEYVKFVFKQVLVSNHTISGAEQGDQVLAQVALNFAEYVFTYKLQEAEGTSGADVTQGWNIATNESAG